MNALHFSTLFCLAPLTAGACTLAVTLALCALRKAGPLRRMGELPFKVLCGAALACLVVPTANLPFLAGLNAPNACSIAAFCGGFVFGAPAGFVASLCGGGIVLGHMARTGSTSAPTAVMATLIAGLLADMLRRWMFKGHMPRWLYGFVFGSIAEVMHWTLVVVFQLESSFLQANDVVATMVLYTLENGAICAVVMACAHRVTTGRWHVSGRRTIAERFHYTLTLCFLVCLVFIVTFSLSLGNGTMGFIESGYYSAADLAEAESLFLALEVFASVLLFCVLLLGAAWLLKRFVTDNIHQVNYGLALISEGRLGQRVEAPGTTEFEFLADNINSAADTMRESIAKEAARMDAELETAQVIQSSVLPPQRLLALDRPRFDLFASMEPAREVGGDFYDYFIVDGDHVGLCIADVSGKGISAALFMMRAKALIKDKLLASKDVAQTLTEANDELCRGNAAEMFVTCWLGVLDLRDGTLSFANAGHNPPALQGADGSFALLDVHPNLVLAGMEGMPYRRHEVKMAPGATLFLYTDGITEAQDAADALFEDERMLACLNAHADASPEALVGGVRDAVAAFVGDAPQFDDMTMLAVCFTDQNVLRVAPSEDSIPVVAEFVEETLTSHGVPIDVVFDMNVVVDEVYSNICHYSGATQASVECHAQHGRVSLYFTDNGKPYNPLDFDEPDVTLSPEEREIGGLGIFITKQTTDRMVYTFKDDRNTLFVSKDYAEEG